jgi:transposase
MAAWHHHQRVAPLTDQGDGNRAVFETWLAEKRLPVLAPDSVSSCDHASFHNLYLPPYSPDLNPLEQPWFVLKNWMRKQIQSGKSFRQVVDQAFID